MARKLYGPIWRLIYEGGIAPSEFGIDLTDPDDLNEANAAFEIYAQRMKNAMKPKGKGR